MNQEEFIYNYVATNIATRSAIRTEENWGKIHQALDLDRAVSSAVSEARAIFDKVERQINPEDK